MPVLVLHGDSDVALGVELLDGIEAVAPKATVKILKSCSHWCVLDAGGCSAAGSDMASGMQWQ
jgi:pimeloyl-ACP methyl ester carboxylesterase